MCLWLLKMRFKLNVVSSELTDLLSNPVTLWVGTSSYFVCVQVFGCWFGRILYFELYWFHCVSTGVSLFWYTTIVDSKKLLLGQRRSTPESGCINFICTPITKVFTPCCFRRKRFTYTQNLITLWPTTLAASVDTAGRLADRNWQNRQNPQSPERDAHTVNDCIHCKCKEVVAL